YRLVVRLPLVRAHGRFEGGVAHADGAVRRPRFARAVGHVGVDLEHKGWLILLRDLPVGHSGESDFERAISLAPRHAVLDCLALTAVPVAAIPTPPPRHPHLPHHAVSDLRPV